MCGIVSQTGPEARRQIWKKESEAMLTYKDWTRYIVKRLLLMIPILLGISLIIFSIMEFTPGDPVIRKLGTEADPAAYELPA